MLDAVRHAACQAQPERHLQKALAQMVPGAGGTHLSPARAWPARPCSGALPCTPNCRTPGCLLRQRLPGSGRPRKRRHALVPMALPGGACHARDPALDMSRRAAQVVHADVGLRRFGGASERGQPTPPRGAQAGHWPGTCLAPAWRRPGTNARGCQAGRGPRLTLARLYASSSTLGATSTPSSPARSSRSASSSAAARLKPSGSRTTPDRRCCVASPRLCTVPARPPGRARVSALPAARRLRRADSVCTKTQAVLYACKLRAVLRLSRGVCGDLASQRAGAGWQLRCRPPVPVPRAVLRGSCHVPEACFM